MNTSSILISTALCAAMFLSSCGSPPAPKLPKLPPGTKIRTLALGSSIPKSAMGFTNTATANADMSASTSFGILPMLIDSTISKGVNAAVRAGPQKEIERVIQAHGIDISQIVREAFETEIRNSGTFVLGSPASSDAVFDLSVGSYGLFHRGGMLSITLAPAVGVAANLMKGKGGPKLLEFGFAANANEADWHNFDEFKANPELICTGWRMAAREDARRILADLRKILENAQAGTEAASDEEEQEDE